MMNHTAKRLKTAADPACPVCAGEGWIEVTYNSRPDIGEPEACACVERGPADEPDNIPDEAPAPTCDPRPFLHHQALAFAWCRATGRRGDERQILRLMTRHTAAALAQMLAALDTHYTV